MSLYLVDPTAIGMEFAPHTVTSRCDVPDAAAARLELEDHGVHFTGEHDTGVCNMAFVATAK